MKILQVAFIVVFGSACLATYATSQTMHSTDIVLEQSKGSAPTKY